MKSKVNKKKMNGTKINTMNRHSFWVGGKNETCIIKFFFLPNTYYFNL